MVPGDSSAQGIGSPPVGYQSPVYYATSPGYEYKSPEYGVNSPGYQAESPVYDDVSPGFQAKSPNYYPPSPVYGEVSDDEPASVTEQPTKSPTSQQEDDFDMMGGGLDDIKLHKDDNSVLIAIPFENKTVHTEENERHLIDYIANLRQSLNQYILQQESMSHMNYKIVVLKHNKDILTGKEIILSGLSDLKSPISPISRVIENNGSLSENKYKTHFNKGALYNIAGNIAMHDSHIKNIILHPMGFIPNNHMVAHYFDNPRSSVQLLSIDSEFNGPILMNKRTFFKNSFPNHLWSDFNTNVVYEKILKQNNIPIRKFIDINARWTESPDPLEMDDYMQSNELVDLDSVYYEQNNIVRNQWYKTKNIQTVSDNSTIYDVKLDFNCNPISNIDNSFIFLGLLINNS